MAAVSLQEVEPPADLLAAEPKDLTKRVAQAPEQRFAVRPKPPLPPLPLRLRGDTQEEEGPPIELVAAAPNDPTRRAVRRPEQRIAALPKPPLPPPAPGRLTETASRWADAEPPAASHQTAGRHLINWVCGTVTSVT